MKTEITATPEEIKEEARVLANTMWDWNFGEAQALELIRDINESLAEQAGFEEAFHAEWQRLWNE